MFSYCSDLFIINVLKRIGKHKLTICKFLYSWVDATIRQMSLKQEGYSWHRTPVWGKVDPTWLSAAKKWCPDLEIETRRYSAFLWSTVYQQLVGKKTMKAWSLALGWSFISERFIGSSLRECLWILVEHPLVVKYFPADFPIGKLSDESSSGTTIFMVILYLF